MAASLVCSLLALEAVCASTTLSKSLVYELIGEGSFPSPVKIGKRRVAWRSEAVQAWMDSRLTTAEIGVSNVV